MKRILFVSLLLVSLLCNSQRRYAADRYFNEFAYKKSAELYKVIYEKGDSSQLVISRLGDSYYYNTNSNEAEKWYEILMKKYSDQVSPEYLFRYAQTLKSNGKVKESDLWLEKLKDRDSDDSRALALVNNRNYFVEYSNRKKTFVNVKNLSVNTEFSDFGGFIYDSKLYFASTKPGDTKTRRRYKWNNQPFLNVYTAEEEFSDIAEGLELAEPQKFLEISTRYHESNVVLSEDGNTLYFTRDNYDGDKLKGDEDRVTHLKIYKAQKIDGEWKNFEELLFNNDDYSCGHPALSSDGKTLYFVSDMPGGFGATDIYSVSIADDGTFGTPKNLGKTINTESREMFPYVDKDNTLYFASDGHLGLGALDVFESKISEATFTKPVNLGSPVNSPLDDFSFVISDDKSYGYFSSNRKGGKGDDDIYSFVIYRCKEDITGIVTDSRTGDPIGGATVRLIDEKGEPVSQQITKNDGRYTFKDIACENNYTVAASKEDYRNDKKDTATEDVDKKTIQADLTLESLIVDNSEEQSQIVINPIYFDFDLYNIREDAEYELEHIVTVMNNNPDMVIRIESHTDSRGTKAYNRTLSTNRAKSTRDYIISRGIAANRIESAIGYGEDRLLNHCDDANQKRCSKEEHQQNRRSYFYIVKGAKNVSSTNQKPKN
ncbi:OmpA family protein [uncultured Tenacibaculum sp.]|uniref:OmpA family protein n=1 Tax=uncultured Tenacibaculum sp. TaxID=174713 RepID=UPI00262329DC|nr:OmpA family protein [uncultured Tenacibaculum sp.]